MGGSQPEDWRGGRGWPLWNYQMTNLALGCMDVERTEQSTQQGVEEQARGSVDDPGLRNSTGIVHGDLMIAGRN